MTVSLRLAVLSLCWLAALSTVAPAPRAAEEAEARPVSFDAEHVVRALEYLEAPSEERLERLAATLATAHLRRHAEHTGYFPRGTSGLEIARDLVAGERAPAAEPAAVARLLATVQADTDGQQACIEAALRHLPPDPGFAPRVFLTWGYDIGVATPGSASLNLAHPRFAADPREIWHYCTHEVHHAGVMRWHPLPDLGAVETTDQLLALVRFLTFLEGTAVHAAWAPRRARGELNDPDYRALADPELMIRLTRRYLAVYRELEDRRGRAVSPDDWALLAPLSDGDRLWYRVGAQMAAAIEAARGRAGLLGVVRDGPDAFFTAARILDGDAAEAAPQ